MRLYVYPYKMGSQSGRLVAAGLGARRLRPVPRRYRPRVGDVVINWGSSIIPNWYGDGRPFLNQPQNVAWAANKLHTLRMLQQAGVAVPIFTTRSIDTVNWPVTYCRQLLTGHSGQGIVVSNNEFDAVPAPLYVKGIENHGEYRVHVVDGEVIDYAKKRRRHGEPATEAQRKIRNLENGWIYTRDRLRRLERIEQLAVRAVAALGLDFGAVDIIKDENGNVFVLEVNCAPGLSDSTLNKYLDAFNNLIYNQA